MKYSFMLIGLSALWYLCSRLRRENDREGWVKIRNKTFHDIFFYNGYWEYRPCDIVGAVVSLVFPFSTPEKEKKMELWNNDDVAKRIKKLRVEHAMTQNEVASKLHYATRTTISDYETARRGINIDVVVAYADLFDVSVDWILRGTDSFKKESGSETDDLLSIFFFNKGSQNKKGCDRADKNFG